MAALSGTLRKYAETVHHKRLAEFEARYGRLEAIRHSFLVFASQASDNDGSCGCFLTNTALELAARDADAGRIVAQAQKETEAWFARMIRKGGDVPPGPAVVVGWKIRKEEGRRPGAPPRRRRAGARL